jgi:hypothetical protein
MYLPLTKPGRRAYQRGSITLSEAGFAVGFIMIKKQPVDCSLVFIMPTQVTIITQA